jgi:hypothetical protein
MRLAEHPPMNINSDSVQFMRWDTSEMLYTLSDMDPPLEMEANE